MFVRAILVSRAPFMFVPRGFRSSTLWMVFYVFAYASSSFYESYIGSLGYDNNPWYRSFLQYHIVIVIHMYVGTQTRQIHPFQWGFVG